ncbi:MAG: hypothetical protein NTV10_04230 [Methanoregula sp.]|nr:hypothetical protein [Methanoregula sp.]
MKTPGIYYGVIAAFCVLTLCIGMVNATDVTQSATNCHGLTRTVNLTKTR